MTAEEKMCTIRLVRPNLIIDRLRSYKIMLDGKNVGKIGNNSILEIAAPAGSIEIEAKLDWVRSPPLIIDTVPHQTFEIEVRNRWGAAAALWAVTFGRGSYLSLTPLRK